MKGNCTTRSFVEIKGLTRPPVIQFNERGGLNGFYKFGYHPQQPKASKSFFFIIVYWCNFNDGSVNNVVQSC